MDTLEKVYADIVADPENKQYTEKHWKPLYTADPSARIMIVGQAPGHVAQESMIPWDDKSGDNLRSWLRISRETFYNKSIVSLIPMDFYFPGSKEKHDAPPRKGFAGKWHPRLLTLMPHIQLTILIGQYSQGYYLKDRAKRTLTETVRAYKEYLPEYLPLVHPSPRNNIWQKKNPWFKEELLPELQRYIGELL